MDQYLKRIPEDETEVPSGQVVVHNNAMPTRQLASGGFRAWFEDFDKPSLEPCDCGWAPELPYHYRLRMP